MNDNRYAASGRIQSSGMGATFMVMSLVTDESRAAAQRGSSTQSPRGGGGRGGLRQRRRGEDRGGEARHRRGPGGGGRPPRQPVGPGISTEQRHLEEEQGRDPDRRRAAERGQEHPRHQRLDQE